MKFRIVGLVQEIASNGIPIWQAILGAVFAFLISMVSKLKIGEYILGRANGESDCKKKIQQLQLAIIKMVAVLKTTSNYMNNPENLEQSKIDVQTTLDEVAAIVESIENGSK